MQNAHDVIFAQLDQLASALNSQNFAAAAQVLQKFSADLASYKFKFSAGWHNSSSMLRGWVVECANAIQLQDLNSAFNAQSALYEMVDDAEISPK